VARKPIQKAPLAFTTTTKEGMARQPRQGIPLSTTTTLQWVEEQPTQHDASFSIINMHGEPGSPSRDTARPCH
jgi:hypothetical protein